MNVIVDCTIAMRMPFVITLLVDSTAHVINHSMVMAHNVEVIHRRASALSVCVTIIIIMQLE